MAVVYVPEPVNMMKSCKQCDNVCNVLRVRFGRVVMILVESKNDRTVWYLS